MSVYHPAIKPNAFRRGMYARSFDELNPQSFKVPTANSITVG